jgi:hypothetical protein
MPSLTNQRPRPDRLQQLLRQLSFLLCGLNTVTYNDEEPQIPPARPSTPRPQTTPMTKSDIHPTRNTYWCPSAQVSNQPRVTRHHPIIVDLEENALGKSV